MLTVDKYIKVIDGEILLKYFEYENRLRLYKGFVENKLKSIRDQLALSEPEK